MKTQIAFLLLTSNLRFLPDFIWSPLYSWAFAATK